MARQRTRRRSGGGAAFSRATSSSEKGTGVVSIRDRQETPCPYRRNDSRPFSVELVGGRFQPGPHFAGQLGFVGQDVDDRRVEPVREEGQKLRANPIPRNRDVIIRLVVDVCQVPLVEILPQLQPATVEDGTDNRAVPRIHCRQPARSRSADQPQQQCLGLVVARVAQRNDVGAKLPPDALEELVSLAPRGVLERPALEPRPRSNVPAIRGKGHVERTRDRSREVLVPFRIAAELMIEVRCPDQTHVASRVELAQDDREGDRVRPAGQRDDHPGISAKKQRAGERTAGRVAATFLGREAGTA